MGRGQGSISRENARNVPVIPPPVVSDLNNGLSIDALLNGVLGNDLNDLLAPAQLLSDREIVTNVLNEIILKDFVTPGTTTQTNIGAGNIALQGISGGSLDVSDSANGYHSVVDADAAGARILVQALGIGAVNPRFGLDTAVATWSIDADVASALLTITDTLPVTPTEMASFDSASIIVQLGDIAGAVNSTIATLNDAAQLFTVESAASQMLYLDFLNGSYSIGNVSQTAGKGNLVEIGESYISLGLGSYGNGYFFQMDDSQERLFFNNGGGGSWLDLDVLNASYRMGDISGANNGTTISLDDSLGAFDISTTFGRMAAGSQTTGLYFFGDVDGSGNGNSMSVDDGASKFLIGNTAANIVVNMNGVDGFTGTVTPVTTITVDGGIVTNVA